MKSLTMHLLAHPTKKLMSWRRGPGSNISNLILVHVPNRIQKWQRGNAQIGKLSIKKWIRGDIISIDRDARDTVNEPMGDQVKSPVGEGIKIQVDEEENAYLYSSGDDANQSGRSDSRDTESEDGISMGEETDASEDIDQ